MADEAGKLDALANRQIGSSWRLSGGIIAVLLVAGLGWAAV